MALALAAITVVAAAVRFATLGDQSLDHDEAVTAARVIHNDFIRSMQVVVNGERSPPLYYALVWLWSKVWGTGAIALRSLSAIFGTLTVVFAYLAARELASRRAGLIAACLVALNPYLIWYSQEARAYGLLVMFGALGLYFFARALREPTRRSLGGWAAASALALCTHYFALFVVVPEALALLAWGVRPRRRTAWVAIAAVGAVGLALLPLAIVQEGGGRGNGFTQFPVAQRAATAAVKFVGAEGSAPQGGIQSTLPLQRDAGVLGLLLLALSVGLVATSGSATERRGVARVGAVAVASFGAPLVLAWAGFDFVDPRNLIGSLVPVLVAAGIGFSARGAARAGAVGLVASAALFVYVLHGVATTPGLQRHDWRAAAAVVPRRPAAQIYVVPSDGRTPMEYYTGRRLVKFQPKRFPDGLATRQLVVISDLPTIRGPGPGFRLASTRTAPQHWTVKTYEARRPRAVTAGELSGTKVMAQRSTALVAGAPALLRAETATDRALVKLDREQDRNG